MVPLLLLLLVTALVAAAAPLSSAWHTVEWNAPAFSVFEGDFVVPKVPKGASSGTPYVWPGLQSDSGALQAVLDGRSGSWSLGNGYFGGSVHPLGDRFGVKPGDTVHFKFTRNAPTNAWTCSLSGPHSTSETFSVPSSAMTRAVLAVDLTSVPHDFAVTYHNVVITASADAPAHEWCGKTGSLGYAHSEYTITGAVADGSTCRISSVVLPGTA